MAAAYDTEEATDAEGSAKQRKDIAAARTRLQQAIEATNNNRVFQLDDLRFAAASPDNKFQWPEAIVRLREADPNGPRPVLTINKLPQHILQITNEQRQNRPSIKVNPVDDKADKEVAEILTGIIRHIEYQSDAEVAYAMAGENQVIHGEGYIRVLTDYVDPMSFEQDIEICGVKNAFSVYLDPIGLQKDATGRHCEWGFVVEDLAKDEFERQYPDAQPINWQLTGNGDEWKAWFPDSSTVRVAEYFCFEYRQATLCLWPDGSTSIKGEDDKVVRIGKPVSERKTTVKQLMWQKMNGQQILEERELPGRYIPIVRVVGNEWYVDGRMIVAGIVRNAKDAQRMFNYWKSTECETLALAPKAPFVGSAEAYEGFEADWQQANTKPFAYLKYNQFGENGEKLDRPERQTPPMPPIGIVNAALGAADDIKSSTGQYDPSLGNNPQAKSGIALAREQRKTDIGTYHYLDNQGRAIRQLGRILVDIVPKYYDTKRVARIIGEDGETDHAIIDPESPQAVAERPTENGVEKIYNPSIGKYDVTVNVGPSYTSKRQEAADFMSQVLQGNKELMAVIGDLYFGMLDVPGADEIAKRLKKTLPPNIADDSEDGEEQPVVQTPQGPVPVQQASQMIAQLMQSAEGMAQRIEKGDLDKQAAAALAEQNKAKELEIRADEVSVQMYKAETERMQALGALDIDKAQVTINDKEVEINAALDLAGHAIKGNPKPERGQAAGAQQ